MKLSDSFKGRPSGKGTLRWGVYLVPLSPLSCSKARRWRQVPLGRGGLSQGGVCSQAVECDLCRFHYYQCRESQTRHMPSDVIRQLAFKCPSLASSKVRRPKMLLLYRGWIILPLKCKQTGVKDLIKVPKRLCMIKVSSQVLSVALMASLRMTWSTSVLSATFSQDLVSVGFLVTLW